MKYFLKGNWEKKYTEVTKEQYIAAERNAGFYSDEPFASETATAAFDDNGVSGKVEYEEEDKVHDEDDYECF